MAALSPRASTLPIELCSPLVYSAKTNFRRRDLKAQGLAPADIGQIIGASRATVYRYLSLGVDEHS